MNRLIMTKNKLIILFIAIGLILVSVFISLAIELHFKSKNIALSIAKTTKKFSENVFDLHSEVYLTFDRLPSPPTCNNKIFERLMYKYKHIKNIGVVKDDVVLCDVYGASKLGFIFDNYSTFKDEQNNVYKYWNVNEYYTVISPNGYFVEYDANYYLNFDIMSEISALFIYGRQSSKLWFSNFKHNLSFEHIENIKRKLITEFNKLNLNPETNSVAIEDGNLIYKISITDRGSIVGVVSDTDFVESYHKIGIINLFIGLLLGGLSSFFIFYLYNKSKSLKNQLIKAIHNEELKMVYQPLVNLRSANHEICGFEALVRWTLENGDAISPDIFISVAEKHQLTNQLTCLIIKIIFDEMGEFLRQHPQLYVAINICPQDLYHDGLLNLLKDNVERSQLKTDNIVIELTERSMIDQESKLGIDSIKRANYAISIDDFGTGASNIRYLADLSPNIIKIDRSFVTWSDSDGPTSTLLGSLIRVGTEFGVKIVVEGVETAMQAERCLALGANVGQGYFWYKPMPINEIKKLFSSKP